MTTVTIKMLVTIEFDPAHQPAEHLGRDMQRVIEHGMGNGAFTSGTDATVESWKTEIIEIKEAPECNSHLN